MNTATDPAPNAPLTVTDCARTCGEDWAAQTRSSKPWTGTIMDADIDWTKEQLGRRMTSEEMSEFEAAFVAQYNAKVGAVEEVAAPARRINWRGQR